MPQGLQCRDAGDNLILDVTDRLTRLLGIISTGTTNGTHTDPELSTGDPWWFLRCETSEDAYNGSMYPIQVTITANTNTIAWQFNEYLLRPGSTVKSAKIYYGVY